MKRAKNVEEYIASVPLPVRAKLRQLRAAIKSVAPDAHEKISYGMPYYGYKGRLAYFRHWKNHIGLYIPTPVIQEHSRELKNYDTNNATVRFSLDKKLPIPLIKRLVKARMKKNDDLAKKK